MNLSALLDDHFDEISAAAAECGIDWSGTVNEITSPGTYKKPATFRKKDRSRTVVYVHEDDRVIRINFHTLDDGGRKSSWWTWKEKWERRDSGRSMPLQEREEEGRRRTEEEAKKREQERLKHEAEEKAERKAAWEHAQAVWANAPRAREDHPYLLAKGLGGVISRGSDIDIRETTRRALYGWDSDERLLMMSLFNRDGRSVGYQLIDEKGKKRYSKSLYDGQYKGAHATFGAVGEKPRFVIGEGFASVQSCHAASGAIAVMARDAENLTATAEAIRSKYPGAGILLVGDNDEPGAGKLERGNVGMYAGVKAAIAAKLQLVQLPLVDDKKTDASDVFLELGPNHLAEILKDKKYRIKIKNHLDGIEWLLRFAPTRDHKVLIGKLAVAMGAPIHASRSQVHDRYQSLVMRPIGREKILRKIDEVIYGATKAAEDLLALEADVTLSTVPSEAGYHVVPVELVERIVRLAMAGHHIVLRAPMGTGKTERIVTALRKFFNRLVYLCHRVSLSIDVSSRTGLPNYRDMDAFMVRYTEQFVSSVQSLSAKRFKSDDHNAHCNADLLIIDEATQAIAQCISLGPTKRVMENTGVLANAIRTSKASLFMDADADNSLLDKIKMIDDRPVTVIDVTHPDGVGRKWNVELFEDRTDLVVKLIDHVRRGIPVRVATDNRRWARCLQNYILKLFPGKKELCVTREPDEREKEEITKLFERPNEVIEGCEVLIHSPVISSGFSITKPHFQKSFGFFFGTIGATEIMQMMGRDRTASEWALHIRKTFTKDEELAAAAREKEFTSESLHTRLSHVCERDSIRNRKNLDVLLPLLLKYRGHVVIPVKESGDGHKQLRKELQAIAEELDLKRTQRIISQGMNPVDEEEYEMLKKMPLRTDVEEARLISWEVLHDLGGDLTEDDIEFFDKEAGVFRTNIAECFFASEEDALWHDGNAPDTDYGPVHAVQRRWILREVVSLLELDKDFGGEFDAVRTREVLSFALANAQKMNAYFSGAIDVDDPPKCGTRLVKRLLWSMGLRLKHRKSNGRMLYSVCSISLTRMLKYIGRRRELHRELIRRIPKAASDVMCEVPEVVTEFAPEPFAPWPDDEPSEPLDTGRDDDDVPEELSEADYAAFEDWLIPPDEPF